MLAQLADAFRGASEGKPLPEGTAERLHLLAKEQPALAGEGLELVADLQRGKERQGPVDAEHLALYQESVRLRLTGPASYDVASTALKAAELARRLGKEEALLEACHQALTCKEHYFPPRMAREALAQHHCQKGDYAKALAAFGPLTDVGYPYVDFPAGLLVGARRYREAAALWDDLPESFRSGDVLCKAWALHRAGDKKEAARILSAARKLKGYFFGDKLKGEAAALAAFISGRSKKLPHGYHRVFGPIPHPQQHDANLSVFTGVKALRVASVAAKLHRLAHGDDLALAALLFKEAKERSSAGETHERAAYVERLREGIAILDREKGPKDAGTLPHLRDLFWGSRDEEHWATAKRYLSMSPPADDTAETMASRLALHLAETDWGAALALALGWLQRCLDAGHQAWELAHTVAVLQRQKGAHAEEVARLRQTLQLFNPEEHYDEGKQFELKMELEAACKAAGTPDAALTQELDAARAEWAAQWKKGRGAGTKKAIEILQPYLRPGARFTDAPFEVMDAAGKALGWRFLKMRINARPAHGVLIETCRPHAAETTFSGYAASDVTIESLETKDTPEIREAFAPSADDVVPLKGDRIYFWWD